MFPFFELYNGILVYTFGLALTLCFFLFLWMFKKLSSRFGYKFTPFLSNILWYVLSMFIFSRLFYVISQWNDMKFIENPMQFFIMSDYNFSLPWAIIGFIVVLLINVKMEKTTVKKYIDGLTLSFLFVAIFGYIGAFFGGQVYGMVTSFGIEILYTHPHTLVPSQVPVFPLPIIYAITSFVVFSGLYILSMFVQIRWFIGYMGIILFSSLLLIFEFFSGKFDVFKLEININLTQICAIIFIVIAAIELYKIVQEPESKVIQK